MFGGIRNAPSFPLLPIPLWLEVVACDGVWFMGQIDLFDYLTVCKQMTDVQSNYLCKRMSNID